VCDEACVGQRPWLHPDGGRAGKPRTKPNRALEACHRDSRRSNLLSITITTQRSLATFTYSQFLDQVRSGQVASVVVIGSNSGAVEAICRLKDGKTVRTVLPSDYRDALVAIQDKLVNIEIRDVSSEPFRL
jgi:hypothetical protein